MSQALKPHLLAALLALALGPAVALAQSSASGTQSGMSGTAATQSAPASGAAASGTASGHQLSGAEQRFVTKAAQHGMAEVQLGQLAAQKAGSQEVKRFGQRMVDDHSAANKQLQQIASAKGVTLPQEIDAKHRRLMSRLEKLSGKEFDKAYMAAMVKDHNEDVKDFQKQAQNAKDQDLRSFASSTLPTLKEHQQLARQTNAQIASSGKSSRAADSAAQAENRVSPTGQGQGTGTSPRT